MSFFYLYHSIDFRLLLGFFCLECVLLFVKCVEFAPELPAPDRSITPQTDMRVRCGGKS